jgi:hypothetical protein
MLFAFFIVALVVAPNRAASQTGERCFPETNQCISGRFRDYWEQSGGLAVFGYPLTAASPELNADTGQTYLTQWFERNRFELHPENQRPYDVLLGRLGNDRLGQQGRDWQSFPRAAPDAAHLFLTPAMLSRTCRSGSTGARMALNVMDNVASRTRKASRSLGTPFLNRSRKRTALVTPSLRSGSSVPAWKIMGARACC